jgi:peroxiredoxin
MSQRAFRRVSGILTLVLLSATVSVRAQTSQPAPGTAAPKVGDKAPDFTLETLDAKKVQLAELRKAGPVVVVELRGWVGYQCPLCTRQVDELIRNAKQMREAGATVVLIYPGPAEKLKEHANEFVTGKGMPEGYHFVLDPDMKFVLSWGLRWAAPNETAYPSTFVVDKEGTVRYAKVSTTHGGRAPTAEVIQAVAGLK